jgi:hypothetical protein
VLRVLEIVEGGNGEGEGGHKKKSEKKNLPSVASLVTYLRVPVY